MGMTEAGAGVLEADEVFFNSLLAGDPVALADLLTDDFVIVDVMSGGVTERAALLDAVASGVLRFVGIVHDRAETSVRTRPGVAIVVGRTEMTIRFGPDTVTARSRYTHVFVEESRRWRLLSAQGTSLAEQSIQC
jgi:ketosteroid isomerase-like protein